MKKTCLFLLISAICVVIGFQASAQRIENNPPRDGVLDKTQTQARQPIPFASLREADYVWSKRIWREVDMREKINQAFYYPLDPHNGWKNFITVIMDGLKEGTITAYDISATDEFLVPLSYQQVVMRQSDTIHKTLKRNYPPYDEYDTVIVNEFDPSKVQRFRIKEDWFLDKQRSVVEGRIIGICPTITKVRDNEVAQEPLFWIYYPEARTLLAKAEVFNRFNDSERRTYEDIFIKRLFGSYIYKESNVYDRRINQYATGLDALLESERIKGDLFKFEHDLWEF